MKIVNIVLLVALVASAAAHLAVSSDPARPNFEFLPEMVHSVAYDSWAPNPNFADGKTAQPPVAGTVARPARRASKAAGPERGAFLYQTFCLVCHGPGGKGDGTVVQRGYPPPPDLTAAKSVGLTDEQMFRILSDGQRNMPSYAVQLSEEDRWTVIARVREIQRAAQPAGGVK